jgi:hypothetical protein
MDKWLELILGIILFNLSIYLWISSSTLGNFWDFGMAAWILFKGTLLWVLVLTGILFLVLGINDLRK